MYMQWRFAESHRLYTYCTKRCILYSQTVSAHVNYLQGKIQRNSLQGNTEVTAVHLAQRNQLLGWKNMLCDLLVEWFWFKHKCDRSKYITKRKSKTHSAEEE